MRSIALYGITRPNFIAGTRDSLRIAYEPCTNHNEVNTNLLQNSTNRYEKLRNSTKSYERKFRSPYLIESNRIIPNLILPYPTQPNQTTLLIMVPPAAYAAGGLFYIPGYSVIGFISNLTLGYASIIDVASFWEMTSFRAYGT